EFPCCVMLPRTGTGHGVRTDERVRGLKNSSSLDLVGALQPRPSDALEEHVESGEGRCCGFVEAQGFGQGGDDEEVAVRSVTGRWGGTDETRFAGVVAQGH